MGLGPGYVAQLVHVFVSVIFDRPESVELVANLKSLRSLCGQPAILWFDITEELVDCYRVVLWFTRVLRSCFLPQ